MSVRQVFSLSVLSPLVSLNQVDKGSKGKFSGSSFYYGSSSLYILLQASAPDSMFIENT